MEMERKSNKFAKRYRNAGNGHFRNQEYFEALMCYNRSLCVSENGSESISIAYASRSAVYIKLNQFDLCLENIKLARENNYPAEKMERIDKREEECKELMATLDSNPDDDPFNFFKLSHPPNPKYPQIVDCLELKNNKKFGNHIVTTQDLKTGDIIAIEDPLFKKPNPVTRLIFCNYCLKDNLLNLFPCSGCTLAMFCSTSCQENAMNECHQQECSRFRVCFEFDTHVMLKSLSMFDFDVMALKQFLDANKDPVTVFDFDFSDPNDPMYEKNMMLVMLSDKSLNRVKGKAREESCQAVIDFVSQHLKLKEVWKTHERFLTELVERIVDTKGGYIKMVEFSKKIDIDNNSPFGYSFKGKYVGHAFNPFRNLLRHSCDPNVKILSVGHKTVLHVCKPIMKGSQLFNSFGSPFSHSGPTSTRRALLTQVFGIWCTCEACENNWPTYQGLTSIDPDFRYDNITNFAPSDKAKENVARNDAYVDKIYKEHEPSKEVYITIFNNHLELCGLSRPSFFP